MSHDGFSLCEYQGRKAIRYHHDFGDFNFFLMQAEDGSQGISFSVDVRGLTENSKRKVGDFALTRIFSTAKALKYPVNSVSGITFNDAYNIILEAEKYIQRQGF